MINMIREITGKPIDYVRPMVPVVFDYLDRDKNSKISREEFKGFGQGLLQQAAMGFSVADTNGDSFVSHDEIKALFKQSLYCNRPPWDSPLLTLMGNPMA